MDSKWLLCLLSEMRYNSYKEGQCRHWDPLDPYMMGFQETHFMLIILFYICVCVWGDN